MLEKIILRNKKDDSWSIFSSPLQVLFTHDLNQVKDVLNEVQNKVEKKNLIAAGYLSYEAAPAFDNAYCVNEKGNLPLICFGLFKNYKIEKTLESHSLESAEAIEWAITTDRTLYENYLQYIKDQIKLGNTYQVNYTLRKFTECISNPYSFFLEKAQDAPYAAYIESNEHTIISASPELFFKLNGESLMCKPMKGTSKRGKTLHDDIALMEELKNSEKDKAENIMITDMLRNDMGKISDTGSVKVLSEFDIEKYPTVWQMTSSIKSQTSTNITGIFEALFPCASVTGAPKVSSMKIISEIEDQPREIYTGAIGYIAPNNEAQFSVPIRTILSDKKACRSVYGTGSGIVWDSESHKEWDECQNKSAILSANSQNFELFETMRWESSKRIFLEKLHLDRLKDSAEFYNFKFHHEKIYDKLQDYLKNLESESERIIRLFLAKDGDIRLTTSAYKKQNKDKPQFISFAMRPINSEDRSLYHKTTNRSVYENAIGENPVCDDILLWNEDGNITESTISNVIFKKDSKYYTPPISCGLLGGTYRTHLINQGHLEERIIPKTEINLYSEIYLINSVRGKYPVKLI